MIAIGKRGYSNNSTVTPSAPAPTEDIVTRMPSSTPVITVQHRRVLRFDFELRGIGTGIRGIVGGRTTKAR